MFPCHRQVNLWLGSNGTTARTHYDTSDNFYVPVHGAKLFQIAPPSALPKAKLYPSLHPHYRQSQVGRRLESIPDRRNARGAATRVLTCPQTPRR